MNVIAPSISTMRFFLWNGCKDAHTSNKPYHWQWKTAEVVVIADSHFKLEENNSTQLIVSGKQQSWEFDNFLSGQYAGSNGNGLKIISTLFDRSITLALIENNAEILAFDGGTTYVVSHYGDLPVDRIIECIRNGILMGIKENQEFIETRKSKLIGAKVNTTLNEPIFTYFEAKELQSLNELLLLSSGFNLSTMNKLL